MHEIHDEAKFRNKSSPEDFVSTSFAGSGNQSMVSSVARRSPHEGI